MASIFGNISKTVRQGNQNAMDTAGSAYRTALEKAVYGDAGAEYGQGLEAITRYLAGAGPLADGGAGTALRARLASQVYGGAKSRIANSYADYLRQYLQQQRAYAQQLLLMKQQRKMQKTGIGGVLGGVVGAVGGPVLGAAGDYLGEKVF